MSAALVGRLLRSPGEVAAACREDFDLRALAAVSLGAIALGGAVFGGVLGSFRGGVQIAYAAIKIPLAVLAALAVCVPAFVGLAAVMGRPWPLRSVLALTLASAARASLVLLALAPALWLAYDVGLGYHGAILAAALAYGLGALGALGVLLRGLGPGPGRALTAVAFACVFMAAAGQTGWVLRPFLVRPRTVAPPFLRAREGGFGDALMRSTRSSAGIYTRHSAPCPGCGGRR